MSHTITSRPLPGSPYREHTLSVDGVEIAHQMHAFTPEEIETAKYLYRAHGVITPRHRCSRWSEKDAVTVPADGIAYDGLYLED